MIISVLAKALNANRFFNTLVIRDYKGAPLTEEYFQPLAQLFSTNSKIFTLGLLDLQLPPLDFTSLSRVSH
jgi:hypothetical protein